MVGDHHRRMSVCGPAQILAISDSSALEDAPAHLLIPYSLILDMSGQLEF
jgi:hypothetical protein